eukprot:5657390-Pleurochrysis_carterae.AAC.1
MRMRKRYCRKNANTRTRSDRMCMLSINQTHQKFSRGGCTANPPGQARSGPPTSPAAETARSILKPAAWIRSRSLSLLLIR